MHLSRTSARIGLLAALTALFAMSVAVSSASAAKFGGGTIKLDFKPLKLKVSNSGASPKTSTGGTFKFAEDAGTVTMTKQASGSLIIGASSNSITLTKGKKKIVLKSFVEKLSGGKGQLTAKINGKGKAIAFFDQASTNRVGPSSDFTQLVMSSSKMTLTKAGAAAINKALGLVHDAAYVRKDAAGTASFTADRSLTVVGGQSQTVYDQKFVQDLRNCDIELGAVAPATAIPKDASAPEGGVNLPINATAGGTLSGKSLIGQVNHQGGTVLQRPAGGPKGKAAYTSELTDFKFALGVPPFVLTAFIKNINNASPIGDVSGTLAATLTDTGGTVTLSGGSLNLSDGAAGTLQAKDPPLGADCPIPPGSKIGSVVMNASVE